MSDPSEVPVLEARLDALIDEVRRGFQDLRDLIERTEERMLDQEMRLRQCERIDGQRMRTDLDGVMRWRWMFAGAIAIMTVAIPLAMRWIK